MSLKPDKKSDKGKRWMSPRKDGTRKIKIPYHLVVTEGTKTEPNYFRGLKNAVNGKDGLEKVHLEISGEGANTVNLMTKARQRQKLRDEYIKKQRTHSDDKNESAV